MYLHIKVQYLSSVLMQVNLLHNYTNIAVADIHTHNFNDIQSYRDMFQYYRDSHKI